MRKNHLITVLSLFLLVPASITRAQTISSQKGLATAVFPTQYGNVKVYLPDDVRPGDVISGTVIAEPNGKNARQIEKNLAELTKHNVSIDGHKYSISEKPSTFKWLVHMDRQVSAPMELLYVSGVKVAELTYQFIRPVIGTDPVNYGCVIPSHALIASPVRIQGNFDGDMTNTQCLLNNQPMQVLTESPRQCQVQYPQNGQGQQTMQVNENGNEKCSRQISGVDMQVTTGDLDLRKGQNTFIDVKLMGLQNLPDTALLTITNITPDIVTMTNGNLQVFPIVPSADSTTGTFSVHCPAVSITTGTFAVNIDLDLPDVMLSPGPGDNQDGKCNCSVSASIIKPTTINFRGFHATLQKNCGGQNCSETSITKKWEIISGKENIESAEIRNDDESIYIDPKGSMKFTLKFSVTVTCSDGSKCSDVKFCNENGDEVPGVVDADKPDKPKIPVVPDEPKMPVDSIPDKNIKSCSRSTGEDILPKMDGGLKLDKEGIHKDAIVVPVKQTIQRDDFIPLVAEGADFDMFIIQCSPTENCKEASTVKIVPLAGRVRFEWEIIGGPGLGQFVKLGCLYTNKEDGQKTKGEQVIFMPPFVKLPALSKDTAITTKIKLSIIDDKETLKDVQVDREFEIITRRNTDRPDEYQIEIIYKDKHKLPTPVSKQPGGKCEAVAGSWDKKNDLTVTVPKIILPNVPDNNKMVLGQMIVLEAEDQHETDILPGIKCNTDCSKILPFSKVFEDNVQWSWTATGGNGKFVAGHLGRYVIYQAPTSMPKGKTEIEIIFRVTVSNGEGVQAADAQKISKEVKIKIYQPGIQMQFPNKDFLPTDKNKVSLTSELKYFKDNKWEPALAHMCRIHFFELMDISTEKGICMNEPLPDKADECRDLQFKKETDNDTHEAYDAGKPDKPQCTLTDQYMKARSQKPEKISAIEVYSLDFGSYGFLRSSVLQKAEVIDKTKFYTYKSVPWTDTDVPHLHADKRNKSKPDYTDNRVTIPLDIDENHIPDAGYIIQTGEIIMDPPGGKTDMDDIPKGDGFKGDGLTNYEEYRGFMYQKNSNQQTGESVTNMPEDIHARTNHLIKTIFIHNKDGLPVELYKTITGLEVFEISEPQYQGNDKRIVNFNSNPATNVVAQKGLYLYDGKSDPLHPGRMGLANSKTGKPARPNDENEIIIYTEGIKRNIHKADSTVDVYNNDPAMLRWLKDRRFVHMDPAQKLAAVVAHELLHGNAVWHHGEGNEDLEKSHDAMNGLRSGDITCVMRYDNTGTKIKHPGYFPEEPGTALCIDPVGTSYNSPAPVADGEKKIKLEERGYGNCAPGRGNCAKQIRISGVDPPPKLK